MEKTDMAGTTSETEPMTGGPRRDARQKSRCLGKKCCVVSLVCLFLFLTFIALPGGVMLIVHGGKSRRNIGSLAAGIVLVCLPLVATIVLLVAFFGRRRMQKLRAQNAVTTTDPV